MGEMVRGEPTIADKTLDYDTRKAGKGYSYVITCSVAVAKYILRDCDDRAEPRRGFEGYDQPSTWQQGCKVAAVRIRRALKAAETQPQAPARSAAPAVRMTTQLNHQHGTAFQVNDGGRAAAGYRGDTGDCGTRAVAIAAELSYEFVYNAINDLARSERTGKRKKHISHGRTGVYPQTMHKLLTNRGWVWVPCMSIGSGCTVHLRADELPAGRLVVRLSKHYVAMIDGVVHDTYDPSRDGTRCVYGYWKEPETRT